MSLNYAKKQPVSLRYHQKGSALVIAIFVIVIMSLLGAGLVRMLSSSSESVVYEVYGTRAYAAAQTGIQWQLTQIFPLNIAEITCADTTNTPDVSATAGLQSCIINVECDSSVTLHGIQYYTITSRATCTNAEITTSRAIEVTARSVL